MAVDWNQIYQDKFNQSSKGFDEQRKQYQAAQSAEQAALDQQRDSAAKRARQDMERAGREAYIARTMAVKRMPQLLAAQGISGGMTETTASNIFRDYLKAKSAADTTYNDAITNLQESYMTNSASLKNSWAQKQAELDQRQRSQALEQAKFAYEIALQEEERRRREEEERKRQEEEERRRQEAAARNRRRSSGKNNSGMTDNNKIKYITKKNGVTTGWVMGKDAAKKMEELGYDIVW